MKRNPLEEKLITIITALVFVLLFALVGGTLFALWHRFIWQPLMGW